MIKFLVVVFNKTLGECETCVSMLRWKPSVRSQIAELYIWNNSSFSIPQKDKDIFQQYFPDTSVQFIEDGVNHPLSEVYNEVIKNTSEDGILVLWDHDSTIPEEYLGCLLNACKENHSINLFLPQVFFNNNLVSPAKMFYFWGRRISEISPGPHESIHMTAINSGMAIRCAYLKFSFPGYNDRIKFYGTDSDFMYKYSMQNSHFFVLPISLKHELNSFSKTDLNDSIRRYRDIKNGLLQLSKGFPLIAKFLTPLYLLIESTKQNIIHKTFRFWF